MNQKGFTLIELLVVVAIIGILAAISIPAYIGQQTRAARTEAYANIEVLSLLAEQLFAETSCYAPLVAGVCPAASVTTTGVVNIQAIFPGFQPGAASDFTYSITSELVLTAPFSVPYAGGAAGQASCFVALATGNAGTRVAGDIFAKDCVNNKNF